MRRFQRLYLTIVTRRQEYIGNRAFTVLLAILVGLMAALAAMFLKTLIHFIEEEGIEWLPPYFFFFFPMIGIFIVLGLYGRVFKNAAGFHGIGGVLEAVRRKSSILHYSLMYAQMITAAITIGFGGSSGLESPTVVTGSAIGSNSSRFFRLNYKYRTLFIGCGTAATIAAIFNAPIAGVIFATEVILPQFSATIFIPILIASATGAFFSELFLGNNVLFRVEGVVPFTLKEIPLIIVLGIFAGFVSVYYTQVFALLKSALGKVKAKWRKAFIGGLLLGSLIFLFPVLFGEGYIGIRQIISGEFGKIWQESVFGNYGEENYYTPFFRSGLLILLKPIAASVTVHSGGEGGQFAPSFVTGGFTGFFFFLIASNFLPAGEVLHPTNYILLGMSAVLAGVMHAPLTGIFLVAEVTESYDMFIGLMLVSAISFFTKIYFDKVPIHFKGSKSAAEMDSTKHEFISLNNIRVADLVERKFQSGTPETRLSEFGDVFAGNDSVTIAVRSGDELVGIVTEHQLRKLLGRDVSLSSIKLGDIMALPATYIDLKDSMDMVVHKFDTYDVHYLPVLNKGKFIGFISRMKVLSSFREALKSSGDILG